MPVRITKMNFRGKNKTNKTETNQNLKSPSINNLLSIKTEKSDISSYRDENAVKFKDNISKFRTCLLGVFNRPVKFDNQKEAFLAATKYLILSGQFLGILPLLNMGENNNQLRYPILSWRYVYCTTITIAVFLAAVLCFYKVLLTVTITTLALFMFYLISFISSVFFMQLSTKWQCLMKRVTTAELSEYVDPHIGYKCNLAVVVTLSLAVVEQLLSLQMNWATVKCISDDENVLETFIMTIFSWVYHALNLPYSPVSGFIFMIINFIIIINWSYLHLFVICISLYLSSILEQLNIKIVSCEGQYLPPSYWRKLREDYNRASRLVRYFDDVVNRIVFVSILSNLLLVCMQLYYVFRNGFEERLCNTLIKKKDTSGDDRVFYGYEYIAFLTFSLLFVSIRSLMVVLVTARVHTASMVAAPTLFNVPSPTFCTEIERFIDQMHRSTVALSGLNLFYVTKELVLTIVGTIVTYELVLLQLD